MNISVCMIVRNEAAMIRSALASVPEHYEKVVVDTGSTDDTVRIAAESGAVVGHFPWNGHFADARNHSLELATGDYILVLDADEVLPDNTDEVLRTFISRYPDSAGSVTIRNFMGDETTVHQAGRFFPNKPDFRFDGAVHEMIRENGKPPAFHMTGLVVDHYGYDPEHYEASGKADRYFSMYRNILAADPDNGYIWYQLGKLHFALKQFKEAEAAFSRCVELGNRETLYYPAMLVKYGYTLQELGRSAEAERLLLPQLDTYPDFPDLPFLLGLLAMDTGKVQNIEICFKRALEIGDTVKYASVSGVGSYKAAYNLGLFYEIFGNRAEAVRYYKIAADYRYKPALAKLNHL